MLRILSQHKAPVKIQGGVKLHYNYVVCVCVCAWCVHVHCTYMYAYIYMYNMYVCTHLPWCGQLLGWDSLCL